MALPANMAPLNGYSMLVNDEACLVVGRSVRCGLTAAAAAKVTC
jgi:hypothetical protein